MKHLQKISKPKRLVLIDAHAILHRAYHALPEFSSRAGEPTGALYGLSAMLIKLIADLKPDYLIAAYDMAGPTFRHEAYEQYKAKRPKAEDDLIHQMNRSRDIFRAFGIPIYEKQGFEADDVIGTVVKNLEPETRSGAIEVIIASGDMDTLQLVDDDRVSVYTLRKGISDTILYNEAAVLARYGFPPALVADYKGLRGDPSDNIPGIHGIGEKTATILIQEFGSIEDIYEKLKKTPDVFAQKGIKKRIIDLLVENEEEALFSKTLATIRLDAPIDFSMPESQWGETFSPAVVKKLFQELDFKTLGARLQQMQYGGQARAEGLAKSGAEGLTGGRGIASQNPGTAEDEEDEFFEESKLDEAPPPTDAPETNALFRETALAAWLLDSNNTSMTREDILGFAQKETFPEANAHIFSLLKKQKMWELYADIELPLMPILALAEERGITIDVPYLEKLSLKLHKELDALSQDIWRIAGARFNINSPQQLSQVLFTTLGLSKKGVKKTGGGAISTRESELQKLKGQHEIIEILLKYRELQKLLSTYIDTLPELADKDGRVHTTFVQTGTTTGRLSSQNPNLQNIPVKGEYGAEIRRAFVADKGHVLAAFDYSQIELRVLAILSHDARLLLTFKNGADIHAAVASYVFGVPESEVTKDMRRKAKVINFGIIYGMGVTSLQKSLGGTREEAQIFYENYFKKFPDVTRFIEETKREAARKGYTETLFGRRRYVEGLRSHIPYIRAAAERAAVNAPIQGTAADIIKKAMLSAEAALAKEGLGEKAHLLLQVHDELIYEIEKDAVAHAIPLIKKEMEGVLEKSEIPLEVKAAHGENWGEI